MMAVILPSTLAIPRPTNRAFSSLSTLSFVGDPLHLRLWPLSTHSCGGGGCGGARLRCPPIRMGGGPRTFPGGVSKWQWKRMQEKKAKQLLKARLLRERQIYEMRKRTELKTAVSELERPWEVVERAPNLFSVSADEQVKVLADRFQRPGGFDMWSDHDGPQVFRSPDGLPSTRFFPKGAVHSIKPYGVISADGSEEELRSDNRSRRSRRSSNRRSVQMESLEEGIDGQMGRDAQLSTGNDRQMGRDAQLSTGNARISMNSRYENGNGIEGQRVSLPTRYSRNSRFEDHNGIEGKRASYNGGNAYIGDGDDGNGRRWGFENGSMLSHSDAAAREGEGKNVRIAGMGRNGGGECRLGERKVSLRPTSDLYSEDGGSSMRDWKMGLGAQLSTGNTRILKNSRYENGNGIEGQRASLPTRYSRNSRFEDHNGIKGKRVSCNGGNAYIGSDGNSRDGGDGIGRRRGYEDGSLLSHSDAPARGREGKNGRIAGRGRNGGGECRLGERKVSLRPTSDLYSEDGGSRMRDWKRSGSNGFRTNHRRSP